MNDIFYQFFERIGGVASNILQQLLNIIGFEGAQFALFDLFAVLVVSTGSCLRKLENTSAVLPASTQIK